MRYRCCNETDFISLDLLNEDGGPALRPPAHPIRIPAPPALQDPLPEVKTGDALLAVRDRLDPQPLARERAVLDRLADTADPEIELSFTGRLAE